MSEIWKNGAFLPAERPAITADDRGLLLGDGIFETIKCGGGRPLRWRRHMERLAAGAAFLGIPLPCSETALQDAVVELLARNRMAEAALRITLTRGGGERGLLPPADPRPTLLLAAAPLPAPKPSVRAVIAEAVRRNERSPLARLKSLNYLEGVLARMEAERRGAEDALLLNLAGRLAEASAANLFLVLDRGRLATPPVDEGGLPGTMRAEIMTRTAVEERPLEVGDLARASEAWLANSLGIRALVAVDGRPIGSGEAGPVTRRLAAEIAAAEGSG
jgi:branched-chain amino acid aminotransferase